LSGVRGFLLFAAEQARLAQVALMLVVVAVQAQQFPVAAVERVVVVVVVFVMDRKLLQIGGGEFARAASADPRKKFQRTTAIALGTFVLSAARIGDDSVEPPQVGALLFAG